MMICGHSLRRSTSLALLTAIGFGLSACNSSPDEYSPYYHYADQGMLMPDACVWNGAQPGGVLPPGCANAYNLQQMVESQRDLVQGRSMGPAPAAPASRAAKRYLYDEPRELPSRVEVPPGRELTDPTRP